MKLSIISEEEGVIHVACEGEISQDDFRPGQDPMRDLLGPEGFARKVLVNMEKTSYTDSSGIAWLLVCQKHFVENHGMMVLHSIPPRVYHILQIMRMPLVLHIAPDEAAARALLTRGGKP